MIDVKLIRENPDKLREAIKIRNVDTKNADVDKWLKLDEEKRTLQKQLDSLNGERNKLKGLGKTNPDAAREKGQKLRKEIKELEQKILEISKQWQKILDWFPNWPHPDMPIGMSENDNVEECAWIPGQGYLAKDKIGINDKSEEFMPKKLIHTQDTDFKPLHHIELGVNIDGIDVKQAGKVSGSRFAYLLGDISLMQTALTRLLEDKLIDMGYNKIIPPLLVREHSLYGTSHFPEGQDQVYKIENFNIEDGNELYLVGSSEPSNFSFFMDKTMQEKELPIKFFASTTCFRSEAGSWGKDVKGIKRVHQFDKIEMNAVCSQTQSEEIYNEFKDINEWLLQTLELPYRIIDKCGGDAGYLAAHRQRDIEVWLSGMNEYMEVMTDTNATEYQARRLNIRYKQSEGSPLFCHTVNDTGCAMGRIIIAILDNYQQKNGSIKVPTALKEFMKKDFLEPK